MCSTASFAATAMHSDNEQRTQNLNNSFHSVWLLCDLHGPQSALSFWFLFVSIWFVHFLLVRLCGVRLLSSSCAPNTQICTKACTTQGTTMCMCVLNENDLCAPTPMDNFMFEREWSIFLVVRAGDSSEMMPMPMPMRDARLPNERISRCNFNGSI